MFELPSNNVTPLVDEQWEIAIASDPFCVGVVHDSFRCWADCQPFRKFTVSSMGDPGDFWGKSFDMVFFFIQEFFRDQEGKVGVFYSFFLEFWIEIGYDGFPDFIAVGS